MNHITVDKLRTMADHEDLFCFKAVAVILWNG